MGRISKSLMFPKISNDEQGGKPVDSTKDFLPHWTLGLSSMALIRYCMLALILSAIAAQAQVGGMGGMGGGGGFGGPSVLGRAGAGAGRRGEIGNLTVFAGAQGVYDTGLSAVSRDANGDFRRQALAGIELTYGAVGAKNFRRSAVALNYQGDFIRYNGGNSVVGNNWNGSNQSLSLSASTQMSRRTMAGLAALAGTTNRAFGGFAFPVPLDPGANAAANIPLVSVFDNRIYFFNGIGQVSFQHNNRWSTSIGGGGTAIRRRDNLVAVDLAIARADTSYRITRNQIVGLEYQYMTFQFPRAFGDSHMHGLALIYSLRFARRWDFSARAGVFRLETLGQRLVQVDPLIAELTGVNQAAEVSFSRNLLPQGQVTLSRSFRRGSWESSAMMGPMPGNGLLLTSNQLSVNTGYNHTLSRKATIGIRGTYFELRGVGLVAGSFSSYVWGGNFGYRITRTLQLNATVDRRVSAFAAGRNLNFNGTRFAGGIMWSPSSIPISLW